MIRLAGSCYNIRKVMFSMNRNKAPGSDGFSARFYHKACPVVGHCVEDAILEFFGSRRLLREVNSTIITLVQWKMDFSSIGEYRPISCCNVIYRCITKILANRLLPSLDEVVSLNQWAFIPRRSIAENILLAQALVSDYHKEKGSPRCTLKVDLVKAYDSVSWDFIIYCLSCFGAPPKFVGWVKTCISTPSFSIALNGSLVGSMQQP
jgi:hypothetical protein